MQITRSTIDTVHGPSDWFTGDVYIDAVAAAPPPLPGSRPTWSTSCPAPERIRTATRSARPSSSPKASASANAAADRWRSSDPATASSSKPTKNTGTAPTPNRLMAHLAINEGDDQNDVVHWLAPVTDDEYATAPDLDH